MAYRPNPGIFVETDNLPIKFISKCKKINKIKLVRYKHKIAKAVLKKKKSTLNLHDSKIYYKASVIYIYCGLSIRLESRNRPPSYAQLISTKVPRYVGKR